MKNRLAPRPMVLFPSLLLSISNRNAVTESLPLTYSNFERCEFIGGLMGSSYPAGWRQWRLLVDRGAYENHQGLDRFAARFRMASGMRSVVYPGIRRLTAEGYSVALRVALAYTALEAWGKFMGIAKLTVIDDQELADDFRGPGLRRLREHLLTSSRSVLQSRVALVIEADDVSDVRPLFEAIRNAVFHGDLTPGGAGLTRSAAAQAWTWNFLQAVLDTVKRDF